MWKPVYLIVALMIGLFILVSSSALSPTWQGILEGLIVIAGLGLVTFWLDMHPSAFITSESKKSDYTVYEYFPAGEMEEAETKIFQPQPDSGVVAPPSVI